MTDEKPENWSPKKYTLSLIIPCFNEASVLSLLHNRLEQTLRDIPTRWEVIFVDDGSTDTTYEQLTTIHSSDQRFKVLRLSRNFGHQAAILAGLHHSTGSVVAIMDADLQDPPELLRDGLTLLQIGYDVVYAIRNKRKEHILKRIAYASFYRILRLLSEVNIPLDSGDFCLMRRRVVNTLMQMPERNLFLRGLRAWVGFRQIGISYERPARAAGKTKYSFKRLIHLAADGIFSFTTVPLKVGIYIGLATLITTSVAMIFLLCWRIFNFRFIGHTAQELPGWTALALGILSLGGLQMLLLGILGEYLGRIYKEVKQRPHYVVRDRLGFTAGAEQQ